jgi:hypothetical protein
MRIQLCFLIFFLMLGIGCRRMSPAPSTSNESIKMLDEASAVGIAKKDFGGAQEPSKQLQIKAIELADAWRIEVHAVNELPTTGAGAEYVIDKATGNIRSKRIYQ